MIEARDLVVGDALPRRLDGVTMRIEPGELVIVVGPNGSGKSTLLRSLCGEVKPLRGEVEMDGRPLALWRRRDAAVRRGVLLQEVPVQFPFRVQEVVRLGRSPHRGALQSVRDVSVVREVLAAVGVAALEHRFYSSLSGGERQRVQLARVLAQVWERPTTGARYLLLDEPTANLDPAHQHRVLQLARAFAHDGAGVLAVVHDLQLCARYADRLILLCAGRIAAQGAVEAVLRPEIIEATFGVRTTVVRDAGGTPYLLTSGVDDRGTNSISKPGAAPAECERDL